MYLFYIDESGSRDKVLSFKKGRTPNHIYVLTAVGFYENHWNKFDQAISRLKLDMIKHNNLDLKLSDCEVKSNWLRNPKARKKSKFLDSISDDDRTKLQTEFYHQLDLAKATLISVVIDKRNLAKDTSIEKMHQQAYELLLERIRNHMKFNHPSHNAIIIMDDTGKNFNSNIAMLHAKFQREGNKNVKFGKVIEYPLFTASELSNGIQLADLCAYNVYSAFVYEDFAYEFFGNQLRYYSKHKKTGAIFGAGIKIWPNQSVLYKPFSDYLEDTKFERHDESLKQLKNHFNKG